MNLGLQGQLAVVSGSTAGIGLAVATALAAEGATVIINGRTEGRVSVALEKIRQRVATANPPRHRRRSRYGGRSGRLC
jgi:NAD(P)-dependent dehydrogenase (short-subunit alcohol dehydrogenase family)